MYILGSDVRSQELYYHNPCFQKYLRSYKYFPAEESDGNLALKEYISLSKVKEYIEGSDEETFVIKDLEEIYLKSMESQGHTIGSHTTRFASKLEDANLGLKIVQTTKSGKYVAVKNDILKILESESDWVQLIKRVVDPIRSEIIEIQKSHKPSMSDMQPWEIKCPKLKFLVSFLCLGDPEITNLPLSLETICQMIIYNSKQKYRPGMVKNEEDIEKIRHPRESECPIIHYTTLKLYSTIRSRTIIQVLHQFGITLSYSRVKSFLDELSLVVNALYSKSENKVLPSTLKKDLFTIFIDDNLDKNSRSVDGKGHFHGTAVSVLQFPTQDCSGITRMKDKFSELSQDELNFKSCEALDEFLNVQSIETKTDLQFSFSGELQSVDLEDNLKKELETQLNEETKWLVNAIECMREEANEVKYASWTSFHTSKNRNKSENIPTIHVNLPLLDYKSSEIELQYHLMATAVKYTRFLNPGQVAVGCSDQPLYAIKRTIQWMYPDVFGNTYFAFMGGLHIEQAALTCIGQLVTGTGIENIISAAALDTVGLVSAVCDVNNIKKARYTIQVLIVVLVKNLQKAYETDKLENDTNIALEKWSETQSYPMFKYWYNVIHYIKVTLLFIRSLRECNFKLFTSSLEALLPLFFALDHVHYARWGSVFVYDLKSLPEKFPALHEKFMLGHFTINTKGNKFSNIAMDQAQEHSNKKIKSTAGYIDLVNDSDKTYLRKLELCLPEIDQYLNYIENTSTPSSKHKEVKSSFINKFISDCRKVDEKLLINPFAEETFFKLNTNYIFPEVIVNDTEKVFNVGHVQYEEFRKSRFIEGSKVVIDDKIKKNQLKLPKDATEVQIESPSIKITESMFIKMRDSCTYRTESMKECFSSEISGVPECFLDKKGKEPYHNPKSKILDCMVKQASPNITDVDGLVVDLSLIIRTKISVNQRGNTFNELSSIILQEAANIGEKYNVKRVDLVSDQYSSKSIKSHTRSQRTGKFVSPEIEFNGYTQVPDNINGNFINNEKNKTKLNHLIAVNSQNSEHWTWKKEFNITNNMQNVYSNDGEREIYTPGLIEVLEEADNRIICHIHDMISSGISNICVRTGDSDVVVILLGFMSNLLIKDPQVRLHVDFGSGENRKMIDINACFEDLGSEICDALPFFHCFSGADSTCAFYQKSKKSWFSSWMNFELKNELTSSFTDLCYCPSKETIAGSIEILGKFVVHTYGGSGNMNLNDLRFTLFQNQCKNELRCLPPSLNSLTLHIERSAYQAGWI